MRAFRWCWVVMFLVVLSLAASAQVAKVPPTTDTVAKVLGDARAIYEAAMEDLRKDIRDAIKLKIIGADKENTEAVKQVAKELDAFDRQGAWPDVPRQQQFRERYARIAASMQKAYGSAIAAYTASDDSAVRMAVTEELEEFERQSDIVPWSKNLVADVAESARTLGSSASILSVELPNSGAYRLEVTAMRSSDAGILSVEFPGPENKRLSVSPRWDGQTVALLLTVAKERVIGDLGTIRPIQTRQTTVGNGRNIALSATDGAVVVESVRAKPIIFGGPEQLTPKSKPSLDKPKARSEPKADGIAAVFPSGSTWRGTFVGRDGEQPGETTGTVTRVSGDVATMDWTNQHGRWEIRLATKDNRVVLLSCRGLSQGKTVDVLTFDRIDIGGPLPTQDRPGHVVLSGTWHVHHRQGNRWDDVVSTSHFVFDNTGPNSIRAK